MSEPLRLAIVGSGSIANTHALAISQLTEGKLTAVCSRNREKASDLAHPAGAEVFEDIHALLKAGVADAILVATPSGAHEDAVLPALRAKIPVLCEKPLEISVERVNRMISEADRSGVLLAGFFPLRCGARAKAIRTALDEKRFGRLTLLGARVKWWRTQEYYDASAWRGTWELDGGGALMNQGIHAVDLLRWFGGTVDETMAFSATLAHPGLQVEDTLAATMRFSSGALGTITAATSCYPGLDLALEISGDRGTAILVNDKIERWTFDEERPEDAAIRENHSAGVVGGGASDPKAISAAGHRDQIAAFCRTIRGATPEVISGREAGHAVAIVEAIYRSTRSGKSESVTQL